jgi:WD40 repeat protein
VWERATGKEIAVLKGHARTVTDAAFSPDGQSILTMSYFENSARLWKASGEAIAVLQGHTLSVTSAAFSPDGKFVATSSSDGTSRLWDAKTGNSLAELRGHTNEVANAVFSPDGQLLATASGDGTARIWNTYTEPGLIELKGGGIGIDTIFSPDGTFALTRNINAGNNLNLWDTKTGLLLKSLENEWIVGDEVFSPDSKLILTTDESDEDEQSFVYITEISTGRKLATLPVEGNRVQRAAFSYDGLRILTVADFNPGVRIWDVGTGKNVLKLTHPDSVKSAEFSPDGKLIVTTTLSAMRIWDAVTGTELEKYEEIGRASCRERVFAIV